MHGRSYVLRPPLRGSVPLLCEICVKASKLRQKPLNPTGFGGKPRQTALNPMGLRI